MRKIKMFQSQMESLFEVVAVYLYLTSLYTNHLHIHTSRSIIHFEYLLLLLLHENKRRNGR